jgi:hypothetical protein
MLEGCLILKREEIEATVMETESETESEALVVNLTPVVNLKAVEYLIMIF